MVAAAVVKGDAIVPEWRMSVAVCDIGLSTNTRSGCWWDRDDGGCFRSRCVWQLNHSEINRLIFIARTARLQGNMPFGRVRVKISTAVRTSDVIFDNQKIAIGASRMELPDGTSLGRNAGKGPPSFIACVTVRASRIAWTNDRCFSLHVDFDRVLD